MISQEEFAALLPLACSWAEEQERGILKHGVPLTPALLADARRVGIRQPEKVRLRVMDEIPWPTHPQLRKAAELTGLISPLTSGLSLRYGIWIRADHWGERRLVVHELVHTWQYERLGGFSGFLQQYLQECLTIGYPEAPLEQEAIRIGNELCR